MKIEELIRNKIFYIKISDGEFIIKGNSNQNYAFDNIKIGQWYNKGGYFNSLKGIDFNGRIANSQEERYFIACEKANKYLEIPLEEELVELKFSIW